METVEGPQWLFTGVIRVLRERRDTYARITADCVLDGQAEDAVVFAVKYGQAQDAIDDAVARYETGLSDRWWRD